MFKSLVSLLIVGGCAGSTAETGSICPTKDSPTYASFGRRFFASYCGGCHAAEGDRHGAPTDQRFDTEAEVRAHAREIDEVAAHGPNAANDDMPDMTGPVRSPPTDHERELLGELLACERKGAAE